MVTVCCKRGPTKPATNTLYKGGRFTKSNEVRILSSYQGILLLKQYQRHLTPTTATTEATPHD